MPTNCFLGCVQISTLTPPPGSYFWEQLQKEYPENYSQGIFRQINVLCLQSHRELEGLDVPTTVREDRFPCLA